MEPIEGSETSAFKPQPPGKYPKENILHKEHGRSLKSRHSIDLFLRHLISSKIFQVVFVSLVYNSALFLAYCCSFLLHAAQFGLYLLNCSSTSSLRIPWTPSECLLTGTEVERQLLHGGELVKSCMSAFPTPLAVWFNSATLKRLRFTIVRASNLTYVWMVKYSDTSANEDDSFRNHIR
jgi:hypothetical protein